MPLYLRKGDICAMHCDAIVNATDTLLSGSGGTDRMIHEAAGAGLALECAGIAHCGTGESVITGGYELNAKYVIHTVGPVWSGGSAEERSLLVSCYRSALMLALEYGCRSIAFPLISAGTFGFPEDDAMSIAKESIEEFLSEHNMTVFLMAYRSHTYNLGLKLFEELSRFVEYNFADFSFADCSYSIRSSSSDSALVCAAPAPTFAPEPKAASSAPLSELLSMMDESFAEMLTRKIKECGMTNSDCYSKANVTKSVFSKIKNIPGYRPTKPTVAGFVLALRLPLGEAREMLGKAGYSLSRSSKFDIILEWFITNRIYSVFDINEVLLEYDQPLIGF